AARGIATARGYDSDEDRAGRGEDAAHVVAEPGAGAAQSRGEQLRQVVGEAAEHAEYGEPDKEVGGEARAGGQVESEREQDRRRRAREVDAEHRTAPERLREHRGEQRA